MKNIIRYSILAVLACSIICFTYLYIDPEKDREITEDEYTYALPGGVEVEFPTLPNLSNYHEDAPGDVSCGISLQSAPQAVYSFSSGNKISTNSTSSSYNLLNSYEERKSSQSAGGSGSSVQIYMPLATRSGQSGSGGGGGQGLSVRMSKSTLNVLADAAPENSFISPGDDGVQKLPHELPLSGGLIFLVSLSVVFLLVKRYH